VFWTILLYPIYIGASSISTNIGTTSIDLIEGELDIEALYLNGIEVIIRKPILARAGEIIRVRL